MLWIGCSPQKHYKLLSFFFDGVPDPNAPDVSTRGFKAVAVAFVSQHKPFVDEQCTKCHTDPTAIRLDRESSGVCRQCHEPILSAYPFMHGAVVGEACLWCHNPHQSKQEHLLRMSAPALCLQCHGTELQRPSRDAPLAVAEHADLERSCLDCHVGHGSQRAGLLKRNHQPDGRAPHQSGTKDDVQG